MINSHRTSYLIFLHLLMAATLMSGPWEDGGIVETPEDSIEIKISNSRCKVASNYLFLWITLDNAQSLIEFKKIDIAAAEYFESYEACERIIKSCIYILASFREQLSSEQREYFASKRNEAEHLRVSSLHAAIAIYGDIAQGMYGGKRKNIKHAKFMTQKILNILNSLPPLPLNNLPTGMAPSPFHGPYKQAVIYQNHSQQRQFHSAPNTPVPWNYNGNGNRGNWNRGNWNRGNGNRGGRRNRRFNARGNNRETHSR